jgi:hypothetical protein
VTLVGNQEEVLMPGTQNEKLRILAVFGNAIVDPVFRDAWLDEPIALATTVLGPLSPYEEETLARVMKLTDQQKAEIREAYAVLYSRVDCPRPPCPEPLDRSSQA